MNGREREREGERVSERERARKGVSEKERAKSRASERAMFRVYMPYSLGSE